MSKAEPTYEECVIKTNDLLAKARLAVLQKGPYFSSIMYSLIPVYMPGFGTLAVSSELHLIVDPVRVALDPELSAVDKDGLPQKLAGVLVHECNHVLRDMERIESLYRIDKELANIAADLPINADERRAKWDLPNWVVYPEKYGFPEGETMEQYFERLMKDPKKHKQQTRQMVLVAKQGGGGGKGKGKGGGKGQGQGQGQGPASGLDIGAGQCGGVAGNPNPKENQVDPGKNPGRGPAEIDNAKRKTAQDAKQFFSGQGRGDCPGWAEELIKFKKRRDRDWVRELNAVVRRQSGIIMAGGADFSLTRPSRRSLLRGGLLRPGMVEQQYTAAIAIDTSGSMGTTQLQAAKNTTVNIMEQTGLDTVWVVQCDARVHGDWQRVRTRDVASMEFRGRGGTDFRPIFEVLKKLRPRPDLIAILTDGDGPAPPNPPAGIDVIWVIVPTSYGRRPASWGHMVVCSNNHDLSDPYYFNDADEA
jgi:predicted metal-dependent peptidase